MTKKIYSYGGWVLILTFLFGIVQLMRLRFSAGDVYPYYSSFRADPIGTKALLESFELCCGFQVQRNHEPFSRIKNQFDSTVLVLGLTHHSLSAVPKTTAEEINYFISNGGRLVITLRQPKAQDALAMLNLDGEGEIRDLTAFWGFRFFVEERVKAGAYLAEDYKDTDLPGSISAHTPLYFQPVHPAWKTVYHRAQHPVIMERKHGRGSLVISSESYFLSNEALARERHPALLAWLVGNPGTVIFDEYHHGISTDPGVMFLARKYDLEWLFAIFLLIALLFIWKNGRPLVPPEPEREEALQSGKESIAGLTNLLRRNIPESRLLEVCYAEWQKNRKKVPDQSFELMEEIVAGHKMNRGGQQNLTVAYNALSRVLKQRR